jgi:hypothetical protein
MTPHTDHIPIKVMTKSNMHLLWVCGMVMMYDMPANQLEMMFTATQCNVCHILDVRGYMHMLLKHHYLPYNSACSKSFPLRFMGILGSDIIVRAEWLLGQSLTQPPRLRLGLSMPDGSSIVQPQLGRASFTVRKAAFFNKHVGLEMLSGVWVAPKSNSGNGGALSIGLPVGVGRHDVGSMAGSILSNLRGGVDFEQANLIIRL